MMSSISIDASKEAVSNMKESTEATSGIDGSKEAAPKVKKASKQETKSGTQKKAPAKKQTASPVKRTAGKRIAAVYVQYAGKEIDTAKLEEEAKAAFKAAGHSGTVKTVDLYIKPEENAAYYVINQDFTGSILI